MGEEHISAQFQDFIKNCDPDALKIAVLEKKDQNQAIIAEKPLVQSNEINQTVLRISKPIFCDNKKWGLICTSYIITSPSKEKVQNNHLHIYKWKD
ncbi:hypothetical protein [Zunongwangia sp. HRR-M8]|uniref:hypothetical protein n=1 Tax=Zunongwangia sp. HRR-M8 TaxID=3015170 RepID=UPI0022DDD123|nr:hypothetical protein [Zunongwangia sp. HRR-M8]WBL21637.1 hypothetical protein PBT89_12950 [Zunongwangia sp. HRR-M8]